MSSREMGLAPRIVLALAATALGILPIIHAGQTTCVQYDPLGRVVSKGGILTTCAAQGKNCGTIPDGCGGTLSCGSCGSGQTCLSTNVCCSLASCAAQGKNCGTIPDGCGGTLSCGTCGSGQTCLSTDVCCSLTSCAAQGKNCGTISDGCGGTLNCGTCGAGYSCSANTCVVNPGTCSADCDADCLRAITNNCTPGFTPKPTLGCSLNFHGACMKSGGTCTCQ